MPKGSTTRVDRVNIRLDHETRLMLDQVATGRGLTRTDVLRDSIRLEHGKFFGSGEPWRIARKRARACVALLWASLPRPIKSPEGRLDDWALLGPVLLARASLVLESVVLLQEADRERDARILVRSLYDYITTFAWICSEPASRVRAWHAEDYRQRRTALNQLGPKLKAKGLDPDLEGFRKRYVPDPNLPWPGLYDRAVAADRYWLPRLPGIVSESAGDLRTMYHVLFRHYSATAHPTSRALIEMTVKGAADDDYLIVPVPTFDQQTVLTYTWAPILFAIGLGVASVTFGWPKLSDVQAIFAEDR